MKNPGKQRHRLYFSRLAQNSLRACSPLLMDIDNVDVRNEELDNSNNDDKKLLVLNKRRFSMPLFGRRSIPTQ